MADIDIVIPGVNDILKLPGGDPVGLRRARIRRFQQSGDRALPNDLSWIPRAINFLDDAQDQIAVALVAGKYLAPKLGSRLVPVLGWGLLANDLLNFGTTLLGAVSTGRVGKAQLLRDLIQSLGGRAAAMKAGRSFIARRTKWIPFALQAGQVLRTYTGYGLQLGGVMATVSDGFWGSIRALGGESVKIQGPPAQDPLMKAARFVSQMPFMNWLEPALTAAETGLVVSAYQTSLSVLSLAGSEVAPEDRVEVLADTKVPCFEVWDPASRVALNEAGFGELQGQGPLPVPGGWEPPTFAELTGMGIAAGRDLDAAIMEKVGGAPGDQVTGMMMEHAADMAWKGFAGDDAAERALVPYEKLLGIACEYDIVPPWQAGIGGACDDRYYELIGLTGQPGDCSRIVYAPIPQCPDPPPPNCTVFEDGTFICFAPPPRVDDCDTSKRLVEPPIRVAVPYPPDPLWDHGKQMAWWLWLALQWSCGKGPPQPRWDFEYERDIPGGICGYDYPPRKFGLVHALVMASHAVWGNSWRRGPWLEPRKGERIIFPAEKRCQIGADGRLKLFGTVEKASPPDMGAPLRGLRPGYRCPPPPGWDPSVMGPPPPDPFV